MHLNSWIDTRSPARARSNGRVTSRFTFNFISIFASLWFRFISIYFNFAPFFHQHHLLHLLLLFFFSALLSIIAFNSHTFSFASFQPPTLSFIRSLARVRCFYCFYFFDISQLSSSSFSLSLSFSFSSNLAFDSARLICRNCFSDHDFKSQSRPLFRPFLLHCHHHLFNRFTIRHVNLISISNYYNRVFKVQNQKHISCENKQSLK